MANPLIAIREYFQHSIAELKKVTWPSRDLTIRYSILVVVISVALAIFFAGLDFALQTGVNAGLSRAADLRSPAAATPPPVEPELETTGTPGTDVKIDGEGNVTLPPLDLPQN